MFKLLNSRIAFIALRFFIAGGVVVHAAGVLHPSCARASEPNKIDEDDDGHYERLPMEPAKVKQVFMGFRLTIVEPGSVYAKAGLRSGDLLKTMNGKAVVESNDLKELPKILDRDKKVELKIERDGKRITLRYSVQTVKKVMVAKKVVPVKKSKPAKVAASSKTKKPVVTTKAKRAASSAAAKKAAKKKPVEKKKAKLKTAEQDPALPSEAAVETEPGSDGESGNL